MVFHYAWVVMTVLNSFWQCLKLCRTLRHYGFVQFKPCVTDFPKENSRTIISVGNYEIHFRWFIDRTHCNIDMCKTLRSFFVQSANKWFAYQGNYVFCNKNPLLAGLFREIFYRGVIICVIDLIFLHRPHRSSKLMQMLTRIPLSEGSHFFSWVLNIS